MQRWKLRMLELLSGIALTYQSNPAVIPYHPSKTELPKVKKTPLLRTDPTRVSLSPDALASLLAELERENSVNLHTLIIQKDRNIVLAAAAPGYDLSTPHLSHSMSKTVIGMTVGVLADRGLIDIDAPVSAFFPERTFRDKRGERMTVAHLLSMRSGISFAEVGSVTEERWEEAFFASSFAAPPGEQFAYNSMNSYLLARVAERAAGCDLFTFMEENIFRPLDIRDAFWERSPEGTVKGGWGLYLTTESWVRLGQLLLDRGRVGELQILSERWIAEMLSPRSETCAAMGDFLYGYHLWVSPDRTHVLFNGMLGQNVWIYPKAHVVVAMHAGNNELFSESACLGILHRFFHSENVYKLPPVAHRTAAVRRLRDRERAFWESRSPTPKERARGLAVLLGLRHPEPYVPLWDRLIGEYDFCENNASLLPLFVRVMQNNYTGGIRRLSIVREGDDPVLYSTEGDATYRLPIGLYGYRESALRVRGEAYLVRALGTVRERGGTLIYTLTLVYPELPNTRTLELSIPMGGELCVQLSEMPNHRIAERFLGSIQREDARTDLLLKLMERRLGADFIQRKMEESFAPTLIGAKRGATSYTATLQRENAHLKERLRESEFLLSLLSRYGEGVSVEGDMQEQTLMQRFRAMLRIAKRKRTHSPPNKQESGRPPQGASDHA